MAEPLADKIIPLLNQAAELYHRLILLAAPAGAGKTAALQDLHARLAVPLINLNLEVSRRLLDLTERQRALQLPRILKAVCVSGVERQASPVILLDNIELLFDVSLRQDPLRLLQGLSRNRTVVAAWPGNVCGSGVERQASSQDDARRSTLDNGRYLVYATPDHPEYRRYPLKDFVCVSSV